MSSSTTKSLVKRRQWLDQWGPMRRWPIRQLSQITRRRSGLNCLYHIRAADMSQDSPMRFDPWRCDGKFRVCFCISRSAPRDHAQTTALGLSSQSKWAWMRFVHEFAHWCTIILWETDFYPVRLLGGFVLALWGCQTPAQYWIKIVHRWVQ